MCDSSQNCLVSSTQPWHQQPPVVPNFTRHLLLLANSPLATIARLADPLNSPHTGNQRSNYEPPVPV